MDDLNELERRLTAALDRMGAGIAGLQPVCAEPEVDPDAPDTAVLSAQLDAEREVTAQLEERLRALKERSTAELDDAKEALAAARQAAETSKALQAEIEGLRAARLTDRAEIEALLDELAPILEDAESDA